jgi:uncharacterized membrane protein
MNDILLIIALALFLASAVLAGVQKAWPVALIALGLTLVTLASTGVIAG